ncbi:MAG: hypothetical protein C4617_05075 [Candidatus Liberibacter europaeus]|uniref:Uncharacterized protein n=1 Tax=Candidatus Liberibacter europaeus TaxID=744859 RepID=A0A2T4VWL5_9HYPH|nr:hypothetical protein [Candidatus Liberibacter europaeus]PTL86140.1 MAG: hypothetical protein C4617_05075 [Candidatus Liberibacter europaeus]
MGKVKDQFLDVPAFYDDNLEESERLKLTPDVRMIEAEIQSYLVSALEDFEVFKDPNGGILDKIDVMGSIITEISKALGWSERRMALLKQQKDEEEEAELIQEEIDKEEYENDMSHQAGLLRERLWLY